MHIFRRILAQADYERKLQFVCRMSVECCYVVDFCETINQGGQTY